MFVLVLLSLKKKETNQILRFVTCIVILIIQIALAFFFFFEKCEKYRQHKYFTSSGLRILDQMCNIHSLII